MQSREKKIIKNSIIFTLGNMGSKVFSYVMVLVYTYFISSAELGYYDIVLTTISLLQPLILLAFDEGIYRWLVEAKDSEIKRIIGTSLKTVATTVLLAIVMFYLLNLRLNFLYAIDIILLFASTLLYQMILNAIRGLGNNKLYAFSGIVNSFLLLVFEVFGIIILKMGVEALFLSKMIANLLTVFFIYISEKRLHGVLKEKADRELVRDITKYTVPLIPNSISWWIVNSSDRYMILAFLGASYNGIYSVANKFPTIISTISGIIYFAFQESVIKEYKSPDRNEFYSNIFEKYYYFLFSLVFCGIPATKIAIMIFTGSEFKVASQYIVFLFVSTVFSALSSFLGIGYQISRDTKKSAYTTVSAAIINIVINFVLIRWIGLHAATFSTFISYFILFAIRVVHCRRYFTLHIYYPRFLLCLFTSFMLGLLSYFSDVGINIVLFVGGVLITLVLNRQLAIQIVLKLKNGD